MKQTPMTDGAGVKEKRYIPMGISMLLMVCPDHLAAAGLSGKARLDNQDILISPTAKYRGRFDLGSQLPLGDEFVLTDVTVSFKFLDDREWVRTTGQGGLRDTGRIVRHPGGALMSKSIAGQTDHYYESKVIVRMRNEEEVAELTIGRNKFYGATMRRREVSREPQGQQAIILGVYPDPGDDHRLRKHYRITETMLETELDGYDGPFEIRQRKLGLAAVQDLARHGFLDFELAGKGDYIFQDATLWFQGYTTGEEKPGAEGRWPAPVLWLLLSGFPLAGLAWWKKDHILARKNRKSGQRRPRHGIPGL